MQARSDPLAISILDGVEFFKLCFTKKKKKRNNDLKKKNRKKSVRQYLIVVCVFSYSICVGLCVIVD